MAGSCWRRSCWRSSALTRSSPDGTSTSTSRTPWSRHRAPSAFRWATRRPRWDGGASSAAPPGASSSTPPKTRRRSAGWCWSTATTARSSSTSWKTTPRIGHSLNRSGPGSPTDRRTAGPLKAAGLGAGDYDCSIFPLGRTPRSTFAAARERSLTDAVAFGRPPLRPRGERWPVEWHPAALPGGANEHAGDRRLEAEVVVADDELHTAQRSGSQALEESGPETAVLGVANGDTEHLTVAGGGDAGGDHDGSGHDPAVDAALDVGGIGEHVGELDMLEWPVPERVEGAVELGADPRDLALADAGADPEGLHQVIDLAGAHTVDVGLHHHREQGPVDPPAPLQQRREARPSAQLRDLQLDITSRCRQQPRTVTIALGRAAVGPLVRVGADHQGGFGLDQLLENPLQRRADGVGHLAGLQRGEQVGQVRLGEGHRRGLPCGFPPGKRRGSRPGPPPPGGPPPPP